MSRVRRTHAQDLLSGRIKEEKLPIRIGHNYAIGDASQNQLQEFFLPFRFLFCLLLIRDVPENEHNPEPFPCIRQNGRGTVFDVIFSAVFGEQKRVVRQTDDLPLAEDFLDRV